MISEKIVSALTKLGLHDVVIGTEATSVYGDNLAYALREDGNRYLRCYLLDAANSVRRCGSEFRRYYGFKLKETSKHQHRRTLALTGRKLVQSVFRLLKDDRLYIPPES